MIIDHKRMLVFELRMAMGMPVRFLTFIAAVIVLMMLTVRMLMQVFNFSMRVS